MCSNKMKTLTLEEIIEAQKHCFLSPYGKNECCDCKIAKIIDNFGGQSCQEYLAEQTVRVLETVLNNEIKNS